MGRTFHHLADFLDIAAGFLYSHNVRMVRQLHHYFHRDVITGCLGKVVDQHRERRAVGNSAKEGKNIQRLHLPFVVVGRAHQTCVIAEFRRVLSETKGFTR